VLIGPVSKTWLMGNACRFEHNPNLFFLATSPAYSVTSMGQFQNNQRGATPTDMTSIHNL
jgi:hypothetical protein